MLAPAAVVRCFGNGGPGDEFKVTRQWIFRKGDLLFTLYDWKSTDLYEPGLFTPEEFWDCDVPVDLHIGSKAPATTLDASDFSDWLSKMTSEVME